MEDKLNKIINILDNNTTHPNIANIWKNYILIKQRKLNNLIEQCEEIFTNEISMPTDLTNENIVTMILLNKT